MCATVALVGARQHSRVGDLRLAFTCAGYGGITASECQQRGCCYVPAAPYIGSAVLDLPVCVYPNAGASTYAMSGNMAATGAPARLSGEAWLCERGCLPGVFAGQALVVRTQRAASAFAEQGLSGCNCRAEWSSAPWRHCLDLVGNCYARLRGCVSDI